MLHNLCPWALMASTVSEEPLSLLGITIWRSIRIGRPISFTARQCPSSSHQLSLLIRGGLFGRVLRELSSPEEVPALIFDLESHGVKIRSFERWATPSRTSSPDTSRHR